MSYYDVELKTMNYFTKGSGNYTLDDNITTMNECILNDFYEAVEYLLNKQYDEYFEIQSNTINPAQQNAFMPLRIYRVKRNGHYKIVSIYQRFWGGCWIAEKSI